MTHQIKSAMLDYAPNPVASLAVRLWGDISVSQLGRAARNQGDSPDLIAMLESYFDESADPKRERFVACGGFIGTETQWDGFELLWMHATRELKNPFHATDCECQHGEFADWPKPKCDALMAELVSISIKQELAGYAAVVPIADFKAVYPNSHEYDPFYLAVRQVIANMAHIASLIDERMKFWFEENPATQGKTNQIYLDMKSRRDWVNRDRLAGIGFIEKKVLRMQSGDLLAREAFKHLDNMNVRATRKPIQRLAKRIGFSAWTREALEALRAIGGPENLNYFISGDAVKDLKKLED